MRPALIAAILAVAALAARLIAQTSSPAPGLEQRFAKADRDRDGRLSAAELPMPVLFAAMDSDRDGFVTRTEAGKYFAQTASGSLENIRGGVEEIFVRADRDGDGMVDCVELPNEKSFAQLDENGDGGITLAEARARIGPLLGKLRQQVPAATPETPPSEKPSPPLETTILGPEVLKGTEVGIGRQVADAGFIDQGGQLRRLGEFGSRRGICIAFTSITCPVSKRYLPVLARLSSELKSLNVPLIVVDPMKSESREEFLAAMQSCGMGGLWASDGDQSVARALGATTTTEVFLLDASRTLIYRGAIDDQYGISYSREAPRHEYLRTAATALQAGGRPEISATTAPGCELDLVESEPTPKADSNAVTYYKDIARILQQNCIRCHHEGGLAPFSLEDADEVLDRAKTIKRVLDKGTMPPWFASVPEPGKPSPWINDHSLAARDKADLLAWINGDRSMGDPKDAPLPRAFPKGWQIGEPDLVLQLPQPVKIKSEGVMPYQNIFVETGLTEDKWVQAIEIQPTDREVVHHVLVFVEASGEKRGLGQRVPSATNSGAENHGYFGIYVPGNSTVVYPGGFARLLPKEARLRFQMHYTPKGHATKDQTRVGFVFAKSEPEHIVQVAGISNPRLVIPPHAANHPQTASIPVPVQVKLLAFAPHMHVRGKAFRYDVILPDGSRRTLLDVPRYDFNWQLPYRYAEPVEIPAGSRIEVTGWFDNSATNPANPDPNKTVRWGPQTFDEMLLGYVEFFIPSRSVGSNTASAR